MTAADSTSTTQEIVCQSSSTVARHVCNPILTAFDFDQEVEFERSDKAPLFSTQHSVTFTAASLRSEVQKLYQI